MHSKRDLCRHIGKLYFQQLGIFLEKISKQISMNSTAATASSSSVTSASGASDAVASASEASDAAISGDVISAGEASAAVGTCANVVTKA